MIHNTENVSDILDDKFKNILPDIHTKLINKPNLNNMNEHPVIISYLGFKYSWFFINFWFIVFMVCWQNNSIFMWFYYFFLGFRLLEFVELF